MQKKYHITMQVLDKYHTIIFTSLIITRRGIVHLARCDWEKGCSLAVSCYDIPLQKLNMCTIKAHDEGKMSKSSCEFYREKMNCFNSHSKRMISLKANNLSAALTKISHTSIKQKNIQGKRKLPTTKVKIQLVKKQNM